MTIRITWPIFFLMQPILWSIYMIPALAMVDWHTSGVPLPWQAYVWGVPYLIAHLVFNSAFIISRLTAND